MLLLEVAGVVLGIALLLFARGQQVRTRKYNRRVLRRALSSPEPSVRRAAVQVAGDHGLSGCVDLFLVMMVREKDPSVLLALARVVVRNQWAPANLPGLASLRLWAHHYLDATSRAAQRLQAPTAYGASHREDPLARLLERPGAMPADAPRRKPAKPDASWG